MAKENLEKITPEMEERIQQLLAVALAEKEEETRLKIQQRNENKVSYGCEVVDLVEIVGKPIIDKETGQQKEINGELAFYPNKYTVKLSGRGFEIDTPITQKDFEFLKVGFSYLAIGRLALVKEFGLSVLKPIFSEFVEL